MTLAELRARLETRATEADAIRATAPLAETLRFVLAELATVSGNGHAPTPGLGRLLTVREAAPLLGVTPRWLYRHAPTLPFAKRLGPKTLRFEAEGLATWKGRR